jgi:hypothetical protein
MFWSALRRWGERAVADGSLTIADVRNGARAACTLRRDWEQPLQLSDLAGDDAAPPNGLMRFVAEVECNTVAWLIRLRFINPDQGEDLDAIIAGLRRIGQTPRISRIA